MNMHNYITSHSCAEMFQLYFEVCHGHQQCFKGHRVTVSACHEVYYYEDNLLESQMGETSLKIYKRATVSIRKSV